MSDEIRRQLVSPDVHADRTVTFRLRAPLARQVAVSGLPTPETVLFTKDAEGIWSARTSPLPPGLHSYQFLVDGTPQIDPSNRHVKKWLSLESMLEVPDDPPAVYELTRVSHGTVHQHVYTSTTTGSERAVYVYTPPNSAGRTAAPGTAEWPVLVLLHGYGDDESAWVEVGRVHRIADNLVAQGKIQPTLIVMPHGHPLPLDLKREFDDYADDNARWLEQDLLADLMPFIAQLYPISADRRRTAIAGLSMGGGQSLRVGLANPQRFHAVAGFSSAAPWSQQCEELLGRRAAQIDAMGNSTGNSNSDTDAGADPSAQRLWIACGEDDFLLARNQQFVAELQRRGVRHEWHLTRGGHEWTVWRDYVVQFLMAAFG